MLPIGLELTGSSFDIIANSRKLAPSFVPLGISKWAGHPDKQYDESTFDLEIIFCRITSGSNIFLDGIVTEDSFDLRTMWLCPGGTEIEM